MRIIVFSNFSEKLKQNKHLAPPSIQMLETTIVSACYFAGLSAEDGILFHDEPWECDGARMEYALAVTDLGHRLGMKVIQPEQKHGYRMAFLKVADKLKKEFEGAEDVTRDCFYFWLEHDWWLKHPIELDQVRHLLHTRIDCNYIKLPNYHEESERFQAEPHPCPHFSKDVDRRRERIAPAFMRDSVWSSNPHFGRLSKLLEWAELVRKDETVDPSGNGGAAGVDEVLSHAYIQDIDKLGFDKAHALWGVWLLLRSGGFGRVVDHMGI